MNTKKFNHVSDCVEKLDIKSGGGGVEKIRRRLNRSVDDFDSTEIRLGKSAKFNGAGVYTSFCAYHLITVATFALITYHCLYLSLQT